MGGTTGEEPVLGRSLREDWISSKREAALLDLDTKEVCSALSIAPQQIEDETLEVRRAGDIHRWGRGSLSLRSAAHAVGTRAEELIQDIVFIGSHNQAVNWHTHLARNMAGANITEVAGRHTEADLLRVVRLSTVAASDTNPRGDVVHDLSHQASPVNRVDCTNVAAGLVLQVTGDGLNDVLAIVEDTVEGDVVNVGILQTKHLSLLERGHSTSRS